MLTKIFILLRWIPPEGVERTFQCPAHEGNDLRGSSIFPAQTLKYDLYEDTQMSGLYERTATWKLDNFY